MQAGFGLVEAGSIKSINSQTVTLFFNYIHSPLAHEIDLDNAQILLKNLMDVSVVTLGWYLKLTGSEYQCFKSIEYRWAFGFSISANGGNAFSGDGRFVFSSSQDNWVVSTLQYPEHSSGVIPEQSLSIVYKQISRRMHAV
eukprot:1360921-Amorphochlora_amoeboformis.AAC.2